MLPLCTCASVCKCVNVCVRTTQAIPIHSHHSQAFQFPFFLVVVEEFFFLCSFVFGLKGSSRGRVTGTGEGKRRGKGGYGEAEEQSKHKLSARWANCCHKDTLPRTFHGSRTRARPQLLVDFIANALPPASLPPSLYHPSSLLSARIAFILACLMTNNSIWSGNNNNNRNNNGKRKRKQGKLQAAYQVAHLVASATPTHALCPLKCSCNLIRFSTCPSASLCIFAPRTRLSWPEANGK